MPGQRALSCADDFRVVSRTESVMCARLLAATVPSLTELLLTDDDRRRIRQAKSNEFSERSENVTGSELHPTDRETWGHATQAALIVIHAMEGNIAFEQASAVELIRSPGQLVKDYALSDLVAQDSKEVGVSYPSSECARRRL